MSHSLEPDTCTQPGFAGPGFTDPVQLTSLGLSNRCLPNRFPASKMWSVGSLAKGRSELPPTL